MDNENDLFPELNEVKNQEYEEKNQKEVNFENSDNEELDKDEEINLDIPIKNKKKKKEKIPYDPIMNPKKPKKRRDITIIFLIIILIIIAVAVYFGIENNVVNVNNIKTYFVNQEVTCTKADEYETYSVETSHVFKYRFNLVTYITSTYNYVSDDYIALDNIADYNNTVIANAIGLNGISYTTDISTTEYNIIAKYNIYKLDIKTVLSKNNDNNEFNNNSRVTLIDISQKMNIKNIILDYENQGFICVK